MAGKDRSWQWVELCVLTRRITRHNQSIAVFSRDPVVGQTVCSSLHKARSRSENNKIKILPVKKLKVMHVPTTFPFAHGNGDYDIRSI